MPTYNLVDERWIPCIGADGRRVLVGIEEALARAHEIREIASPEAPVVPALHRLLLAVLHRRFGPADLVEWEDIWTRGRFDADAIREYLGMWRGRFDLFDAERPFYQIPGEMQDKWWSEPTRLIPFRAFGNNTTLFDHTSREREHPLEVVDAARWLVATQSFDVGGVATGESGRDYPTATLLANKLVHLAVGETLFHTLMLNLVRYDSRESGPFAGPEDLPAWERDGSEGKGERAPHGHLDVLTWQSRRLRLRPVVDEAGVIRVDKVIRMDGLRWPKEVDERVYETMVAYRDVPDAEASEAPYRPIRPGEGKALWRDSHAVLGAMDHGSKRNYRRPGTLGWLAELAAEGVIPRGARLRLNTYAMATNKSEVPFWVQDRLPLPVGYLVDGNRESLDELRRGVEYAEKVAWTLGEATKPLIRHLLYGSEPDRDSLTDEEKRNREKQVEHFRHAFSPEAAYWPRLDAPFRRFISDLPAEDAAEHRQRSFERWADDVVAAGRTSLEGAVNRAGVRSRAIAAGAKAEQLFERKLYFITRESQNGDSE